MAINLRKEKDKVLKSGSAYREWRDESRILQRASIDKAIDSGLVNDGSGMFLTEIHEDLPIFGTKGQCESVWARKTISSDDSGKGGGKCGSRIVLTRDNYGSRGTGLGGQGATMCEAIDIVAGSLSCEKKLRTSKTRARGNFITDAARIYLTERGNIQHYFALGKASEATSVSSNLKSGIGIKADHTLIIGRELVRILAGLSNAHGGERMVNGQDYSSGLQPRIELAATGDDGAQPAVLGDNLIKHLERVDEEFKSLYDRIQTIETKLIRYKHLLAGHFHSGAGIGYIQTFPDPVPISDALSSTGKFFDGTTRNVIVGMNMELMKYNWKGLRDELGRTIADGPLDQKLLSKTVHIGR